ncbi:MAG: hypothetical protein ACPG06_03350 [Alphaproteobacteria bacterium]
MARRQRLFGKKLGQAKKPAAVPKEPMTNVALAAALLRQSSAMLNAIAEGNPELAARYETLAGAYEAVAGLTELDPMGPAPEGVEDLLDQF